MNVKSLVLFTGLCLVLASCQKDDATNSVQLDADLEKALKNASNGVGKDFFVLPLSNQFAKIPQDPKNPITQAKIDLGALLFHETGIGLSPKHTEATGTYSCASCHFASAGFQAGTHQGIADGGVGFGVNGEGRVPNPLYDFTELDVQPVRSPSAMNMAYQEAILWNGQFGAVGVNAGTEANWTSGTPKFVNHLGYHGVESQAIAAQDVHRLKVDQQICIDLNYRQMFDKAYPNVPPPQRYDKEHAGLAIAAYERIILANQAPFQLWLRGNSNALTEQEKRGAILFFGKAGCADCHSGPSLAKMEFYGLGMKDLFENPQITYGADVNSGGNNGRFDFTKKEEDKFKFKVPQLYNLADSPFYGHGSSFTNIRDVVAYKNKAVKENDRVPDSQLAEQFKPLKLSETEIDDITAFLKDALRDPNLLRYQPLSIRSGNCFPNNDPQSKLDLGCN
jgi:cytochrome c peroxidase